jgi:hypothetical protein
VGDEHLIRFEGKYGMRRIEAEGEKEQEVEPRGA